MPNRVVLIIACIIALTSFAQQSLQQPSWMPKSGPESIDVFSHISIAKISADKKTILFARPVFRSEQKSQQYTVTVN